MPRLSLYRPQKTNDYKFLDRTIKEMFVAGGTDLYIHKYLGSNNVTSNDLTQPVYDTLNPTNIQDLLFLENRDRKYDPDIYRIRGHYNVQNLDFDLSQFGLFLNNDIIFITVHYNDMIDLIGRKLMVGDVFELPHLTDYHPLNELIPVGLRRFYQITDANFASEGFSQTWYPHLWRIKCEPLVDSQEFANILQQPINKDNYLGDWDPTKEYIPGYTVTYGDKIYTPVEPGPVPIGTPPTDTDYWEIDTADSLKDILGRYNKNIEINDAAIAEAARVVPKSGYDRKQLFVMPTYTDDQPAPPTNIFINGEGPPVSGVVSMVSSLGYTPSPVITISAAALQKLWDLTPDAEKQIKEFISLQLQLAETTPERTDTGSGRVDGDLVLIAKAMGAITGPYGTADNTFMFADQDPTQPGFSGDLIPGFNDYRADTDPRFRYIARSTPRSFGYIQGYLTGDGTAPNGLPVSSGIAFPADPSVGDYFLRTDYLPQLLFRWDGTLWIRISENVRTELGFTENDQSQLSTFINNTNVTPLTDGGTMPELQPLSSILRIQTD